MRLQDQFYGPNAAYFWDLYERFLSDPNSVDESTRAMFADFEPDENSQPAPVAEPIAVDKIVGAVNLANSIRYFGYLAASLDPLGSQPFGDPSLDPAYHGLTEDDLRNLPPTMVHGPIAQRAVNALGAIEELRNIYSGSIGHDFDHVHIPAERRWLRTVAEEGTFRPPKTPIQGEKVLRRLTRVEVFEKFLHRVFPGKFRFSIEGLDIMVPMLDEVIDASASHGIRSILIGMAHRGRLNVLAHTLKKPYKEILAEFKDALKRISISAQNDPGWKGDVKYHGGTSLVLREGEHVNLRIRMAPNPSHLEFVNPVVSGMARAVGTRVNHPGTPVFDHRVTLPILIHGDASFPGQGVVAETLNLSRLEGYETGGAIHIIANNQLGFTTDPQNSRSSLFASDLAKGFEIPIIHVNADDPEACIEAARMAAAYLHKFQKDFLIDLIGYRRYGHNEGDEPAFTQPQMYEQINAHPTVRDLWATKLIRRGQVAADQPQRIWDEYDGELQKVMNDLDADKDMKPDMAKLPEPGVADRVDSGISEERLRSLNQSLRVLPEGFVINSKLEKIMERRKESTTNGVDEQVVDWGSAEELALASILEDGTAIRMTGQDVQRGTFSHRHCVLTDQLTGAKHCALQNIPQATAAFEVINSPLTECATIGFEFGYNVQRPGRLVIWEAQYGDFINGAQVMIDEFLASARDKWGQRPSMVLLLPHGFEGAGPDHSSGRLERFLELAADINMRICYPTTASQYFHLLRRQSMLLREDPLPLVIMTPKSLLRSKMVYSSLNDLSQERWRPLLNDVKARNNPEEIRRLIFCSGKVYYELTARRELDERKELAIVRMEQLYPFPKEPVERILDQYTALEEVVWLQEEPENMGAWEFVRPRLKRALRGRARFFYLGRPRYSSPAEGSASLHAMHHNELLDKAMRLVKEKSDSHGEEY